MTHVQVAAASDPGRVRAENEDAYALLPEQSLFVVSDGMGGQQAGAAASQAVTSWLPSLVEQRLGATATSDDEAVRGAMREAIVDLSLRVRQRSESRLDLGGMGATVVAVLIQAGRAYIAHMGDSRAYLLREGRLGRLTEDHSVLALLLQHGDISPAEARRHPARGQLSRYVGMEGLVYPDVNACDLRAGDRLLLCTDGLTGMLDDERITRLLAEAGTPEQVCRALVDAANAEGGEDNVTALVLEVMPEEE